MGEYARFVVRRKLDNLEPVYREIYKVKDDVERKRAIIKESGQDLLQFGEPHYFERNHAVYVDKRSMHPLVSRFEEQVCKYNISTEWLLCFSYAEMNVIGLDMGVFEAETTKELALERLNNIVFPEGETKLKDKVRDLWFWIHENADDGDLIHLSSDWIYYSPDGEFNNEYVKKDINSRIKELKTRGIECPHWTRKASLPRDPEFVQQRLF